MKLLLSVFLISFFVFFFGCKSTTEDEPTVPSSPSKSLEEPEEQVRQEKPQTIIVPTGSLGNISEVRKKMLEKTLESELDDYFDIVPKDLFEEAQEKAFEELDYEKCTEEQCIMIIKEILQVENAFQLVLMVEDGDTQISLTWNDLDKKRVKEDFCIGCKTQELRNMIAEMVDQFFETNKMVKKPTNKNTKSENLETNNQLSIKKKSKKESIQYKDGEYIGNLENGLPNGKGIVLFPSGNKYEGEFKDGLYEGEGTYIYIDYGRYEGQWNEGKENGIGTFTYEDGTWSTGEWIDGKPWNVINYNFNGTTNMKWIQGTLHTSN